MDEEGRRKEVEVQLETNGAELEGARVELVAARAEVARLKAKSSKYWEDALMEVSRLQARAEATERKLPRL